MTISENGIAFIRAHEGCDLEVYLDSARRPTIGVGHLLRAGESYPNGITQEQADQMLLDDIAPFDAAVSRYAPQCNQNQYDALCSFAFNLGVGSLQTMLAHDWEQVPAQMLRWDKAAGVVIPGLVRRRLDEAGLFQAT